MADTTWTLTLHGETANKIQLFFYDVGDDEWKSLEDDFHAFMNNEATKIHMEEQDNPTKLQFKAKKTKPDKPAKEIQNYKTGPEPYDPLKLEGPDKARYEFNRFFIDKREQQSSEQYPKVQVYSVASKKYVSLIHPKTIDTIIDTVNNNNDDDKLPDGCGSYGCITTDHDKLVLKFGNDKLKEKFHLNNNREIEGLEKLYNSEIQDDHIVQILDFGFVCRQTQTTPLLLPYLEKKGLKTCPTKKGNPTEIPKQLYQILTKAKGRELSEVLNEEPEEPEESTTIKNALTIGVQMAVALKNMHDNGLAHLDVKPENIMWDGTNSCLIDFGFVTDKNATYKLRGTPGYIPLEIFEEYEEVKSIAEKEFNEIFTDIIFENTSDIQIPKNIRQDIYALGITLADVINKKFTTTRLLRDIFVLTYNGTDTLRKNFKKLPQLKILIGKAVHPDPKKRFQTMEDFLTALEKAKKQYDEAE